MCDECSECRRGRVVRRSVLPGLARLAAERLRSRAARRLIRASSALCAWQLQHIQLTDDASLHSLYTDLGRLL